MFGRKTHTRKGERGQSLVELTLGMTVLVMLISGLVDLGRAYFIYVALEDGAGEAALYLSINPDCWSSASGSECADPNNALYRATNAGGAYVDWSTSATIEVCPPAPGDPTPSWCTAPMAPDLSGIGVGDTITVSVSYVFDLLSPFIPKIAGDLITLRAEASQWVVTEPNP